MKKIKAIVNFLLDAGKALPTPPVGPVLGQLNVNLGQFCKEYNEKTSDKVGLKIPVEVTVYEDKTYTFILKSSPTSALILKYSNIKKGSSKPSHESVGTISYKDIETIAKIKFNDMNTKVFTKAISMVLGTAKNMGINILF